MYFCNIFTIFPFIMKQRIIISECPAMELERIMAQSKYDRIFILTDDITVEKCLPIIKDCKCLHEAHVITIKSGDINKTLDAVSYVWTQLSEMKATRHSCMINLGGGMVTDLGGFAASTFKRGFDFINIPTTLLSVIDASVGGKTGFNFNGLKNEIGVFNDSRYVILSPVFLHTLDIYNIKSGYAEMLKHGLISNKTTWANLVTLDLEEADIDKISRLVADNVKIKEKIVAEDHEEKGLRKALNLGHTAGHAFEAFAMKHGNPVLHGYAVAYGLICELYLSAVKEHFPLDTLRQTVKFIREYYGNIEFTCDDYEELLELMSHDKKNTCGIINFTLLSDIGEICINRTATRKEIFEAFDFYREG